MDLYLNSSINWYFGTDGLCPSGKYDLVSIALHELGHGLSYAGLAKKEANIGSFGLITINDFSPLLTSFPFPQLDTLPAVFDRFLIDSAGAALTDFPNPSSELGMAITGNEVYWSGTSGTAANNFSPPRIYAPFAFAQGSSLVHLDENTFPPGNENELMTPFAGTANVIHNPGAISIGMLKDMGWNVNEEVSAPLLQVQKTILFPNPASQQVTVSGMPFQFLHIYNMHGELKLVSRKPETDISQLPAGMYHCRVFSNEKISSMHFIKMN
jgi:hypothetical protein